MHIIGGRKIARKIEKEIIEKSQHKKPHIATILVGGNEESELYAKLKEKACRRVGFDSETIGFHEDVTKEEIIEFYDKIYHEWK